MKIVKLCISSIIDIDGNGAKTATLKSYAKYCLKYYATSLAAKGVILVARCFILIAKNTHAIVITAPNPNRMLNVIGLG